ncbi:MAG: branched-chain amino acid ABC transporter permease [Acidimicrobiales bacterium]
MSEIVESARSKTSLVRDYGPIVLAAALLALVPLAFHDSPSKMTVIIGGLLFCAYAIGFNVIFGSTGQLFLCTGALAGIGGFSAAIVNDRTGVPMLLAIAIGGLLAALVGGLLSWIAVSRSLDTIFTGVVTLAFSLSFENFVLGRKDLTGGETGIRIEAASETILDDQVAPYYIFLGLVVVYLVLYRVIQRSQMGWAFKALRDDEVAAELAGVDVTRYRVYAGIIGSAMLGVAGAVFAFHRGFIGPTTYAFGDVDVSVLVMLVFGGIGSLLGPVVGAVVFTILDEALVDFARLREMLYGIVIVVLFLGFRRGLIPSLESVRSKRRDRSEG